MSDGPTTPPPPPPGDAPSPGDGPPPPGDGPQPEHGVPAAGDGSASRSWWKKPWGIGVIAVVGLLVVAGLGGGGGGDDDDDAELATEDQLDDGAEEVDDQPEAPEDEAANADNEAEPAVDPDLVSQICDEALSADDHVAGSDILNDRIAAATDEQAERRELRLAVLEQCESDVNALPEPGPDAEIVDGPLVLDAANVDFDEIGDTEDNLPGMLEVHRGAGDDVVDFDGEFPAAVIAARHTGSSNFPVRAATPVGQGRGVINEIGPYDGTNRLSGPIFGLEINADGAWTIDFE